MAKAPKKTAEEKKVEQRTKLETRLGQLSIQGIKHRNALAAIEAEATKVVEAIAKLG